MSTSVSESLLRVFDESADESNSASLYWINEERLSAVKDVIECNDQTSSVIDAFVEALKSSINTSTVFMSYLAKGNLLRRKNSKSGAGGLCTATASFCFWTLVPEKPQALVIEDTLLDARISNSAMVRQEPHIRSYAAAPLVTSSGQRVGTLCVVDTQPRRFELDEVALICNFAELIMRMLEGQVMQNRPSSNILKGEHSRGPAAYQQAFAIIDAHAAGWPILASTPSFDEMAAEGLQSNYEVADRAATRCASKYDAFKCGVSLLVGRGSSSQKDKLVGLFEDPAAIKDKVKLGSSAPLNGEWQVEGLVPHNKGYSLVAIFLNAGREFDPSHQLVGIPCLFSEKLAEHSGSRPEKVYICLLVPEVKQTPERPTAAPPIADLKLQATLGAGSFARVYRGFYHGSKVAVKIVHRLSQNLQEGEHPSEASLMQAASHPNLLKLVHWKLTETPRNQQRLWLVTEFCDKGCIADAIDQGQFRESPKPDAPLNAHMAAFVFKQLASGLKALHDADILHCDISGANILLQTCEEAPHGVKVKIADFGLARRKSLAGAEAYTGSYPYLSQEVLRKGSFTEASDCYSLGVVFHEILCGKRAWGGLIPPQIYFAVVERKEGPEWPDIVPKGLRNIAEQLMQYKPEDRCTLEEALRLIEEQLQAVKPEKKRQHAAVN